MVAGRKTFPTHPIIDLTLRLSPRQVANIDTWRGGRLSMNVVSLGAEKPKIGSILEQHEDREAYEQRSGSKWSTEWEQDGSRLPENTTGSKTEPSRRNR